MAPPMLKPGRFRAPDKLLAMLNQAAKPKTMRSDLGQNRGKISNFADDSA